MDEPVEQIKEMSTQEPDFLLEDRYSQYLKDANHAWWSSRQAIWELYQALHAHHYLVQTRYEAVVKAMTSGQDLKPLLYEYHEAVIHHRFLVRRFRQALKQHYQEVRGGLRRHIQEPE